MYGQKSLSEVIFADHLLWLIYRWNLNKKHGYLEETMLYRAFDTPWRFRYLLDLLEGVPTDKGKTHLQKFHT